jgi:cell division protein FtsW (lipid II flippase)
MLLALACDGMVLIMMAVVKMVMAVVLVATMLMMLTIVVVATMMTTINYNFYCAFAHADADDARGYHLIHSSTLVEYTRY